MRKSEWWIQHVLLALGLLSCQPSARSAPPQPSLSPDASVAGAAASSPPPSAATSGAPALSAPLLVPPAAPTRGIAERVVGAAEPVAVSQLIVGEGFGCAQFATPAGSAWQCWDAPSKIKAQPVPAWTVPWLSARELSAGPDYVCEHSHAELTVRCWERPRRGEATGRELPPPWQSLNPDHAPLSAAYSRPDLPELAVLGGTFLCLKATRGGVWCSGDDGYGQLGGSRGAPRANSSRDDPAFVQRIAPADPLVAGTWHACAIAAQGDMAAGGYVACWGRGDHGQLGVAAPDVCNVAGVAVGCAQIPQKGPALRTPVSTLYAGDLFTCLADLEGIRCWGANRDGFFGRPGSCPAALRSAWPTLHGAVSAPRAACSLAPVPIAGVADFQQNAAVGPRGLCFDARGSLKCVGAVPTPRGGPTSADAVHISPGPDASACAVRGGGVVCWGEGYSKPGALATPVSIAFEPLPVAGETAMVRTAPNATWSAACLARRGCSFGPKPIPRCAAGLKPSDWSTLSGQAQRILGQTVTVRGPLGVTAGMMTLKGCSAPDGDACCNRVSSQVVLNGAPALGLAGFFCSGDESASCCNAPAYGQTVVASGVLEINHDTLAPALTLAHATLCTEN